MERKRLFGLKKNHSINWFPNNKAIRGQEFTFGAHDTQIIDVIYKNSILAREQEQLLFKEVDKSR